MKALSKLSRTALLVLAVVSLSPSDGRAQQSARPKRVLMLYWDERDHPANVDFERDFQAALRSAAAWTASSSIPSIWNRTGSREKTNLCFCATTCGRSMPTAPSMLSFRMRVASLDFLLKYRDDLFPHTPIVFAATSYPSAAQLESGAGATGIVYVNSYRKTLDLALKLHPRTEQVFIVSGTPAHDKSFETMARSHLKGYQAKR